MDLHFSCKEDLAGSTPVSSSMKIIEKECKMCGKEFEFEKDAGDDPPKYLYTYCSTDCYHFMELIMAQKQMDIMKSDMELFVPFLVDLIHHMLDKESAWIAGQLLNVIERNIKMPL